MGISIIELPSWSSRQPKSRRDELLGSGGSWGSYAKYSRTPIRAYFKGFSSRSFFQVSRDAISKTTCGAGPLLLTRQLLVGWYAIPLITAISGSSGYSDESGVCEYSPRLKP